MKLSNYAAAFMLLMLCLVGCATITKPETPRQTLAYVSTAVDSVAVSLLKNSAQLTGEQRITASTKIHEARESVNAARSALILFEVTGKPENEKTAISSLETAQAIIQQLQAMLPEVPNE